MNEALAVAEGNKHYDGCITTSSPCRCDTSAIEVIAAAFRRMRAEKEKAEEKLSIVEKWHDKAETRLVAMTEYARTVRALIEPASKAHAEIEKANLGRPGLPQGTCLCSVCTAMRIPFPEEQRPDGQGGENADG